MPEVRDLFLVTQRKPLEALEPWKWLRWVLRRYFEWRGFACRSHVCDNEDGRHGNGKTVNCPSCGHTVVVLCDGQCYASIEYRGGFDDEPAARFMASCKGGEYKPIPFNAALSEESVSYKSGDAPLSEASPWYRRGVMLPFVTLTRKEFRQLEAKVYQTADCAEGKCDSKAV
jgi:hypothetical protein